MGIVKHVSGPCPGFEALFTVSCVADAGVILLACRIGHNSSRNIVFITA